MENSAKDKVTCRICVSLIEENETFSVIAVSEIIMLCTSVEILEADGLPSRICLKCNNMAQTAYEFIVLCRASDKKLREELDAIKTEQISEVKQEDKDLNELHDELMFECHSDGKKSDDSDDNIKLGDLKLKPFTCTFCNKSFLYRRSLEKHEIHHKKPSSNACHVCGKTYSTLRRLSVHINIHNRKGSHLCQTCGKQFTLPENLIRHQRIHTGERRYQCNICNKCFIQSSELKSHMITHTSEKPFLCSFCGNKFTRKLSLRVHIRRIHSNTGQTYTCVLCGRNFKDQRDLAQHKLIHTGERKHICEVCNKAFNRKSNLKVHERIHSGHKPHVCLICQRGFIQKHALKAHIQRTHPSH